MNNDCISGLWVALATPLTPHGHVDHAALVDHATWLLGQGCDGVVPFGTTGEGTSFSGAERLAAVQTLLSGGIQAERIGLGAGCPAVPDTIAITRGALSLGLHHVLLLPPYFYRNVDAKGIEDAFAAVLDGVADDRLRATLYHIPQVSGVPVPPSAVAALRARYGVVVAGVKDSSADFASFRAFRAAAPDVAITVGNEADIARALAEGGAGTICGMANLVPDLVRTMFEDPSAEAAIRDTTGLLTEPFLPVFKAALAALSGEPAFARVRPPLRAADPAVGERIAARLRQIPRRRAA
jgi:4-hydroxy-tetrahydrodipicolinate synthase